MQIAFYLCRRLSLHDQVTYKREIARAQYSRPYDTLTCYSMLPFGMANVIPY